MKLKVTKPFDFAHRGCDVKHYAKGDEIDTETADPELVKVATDEGWTSKPRAKTDSQASEKPDSQGIDKPIEPAPAGEAGQDPAPQDPDQPPAP